MDKKGLPNPYPFMWSLICQPTDVGQCFFYAVRGNSVPHLKTNQIKINFSTTFQNNLITNLEISFKYLFTKNREHTKINS